MSALATVRPDSWHVPLFLHVFGAMMIGGLLASATALGYARGDVRGSGSGTGHSWPPPCRVGC
jgi:hypothetical protein